MATNSGGWLYEATGTPVDKATADNAQARVLEIKQDATRASADSAKALSTANAYAGQIAQANTTAGSAVAIARGAESVVRDEIQPQVDALNTAAGYAPGDATDAAMANVGSNPDSQFRGVLNAQSAKASAQANGRAKLSVSDAGLFTSTDGSDDFDGLSPGHARRTIASALASLPGGKGLVNVAAGRYDEKNLPLTSGLTIHGQRGSRVAANGGHAFVTPTGVVNVNIDGLDVSATGGSCFKSETGTYIALAKFTNMYIWQADGLHPAIDCNGLVDTQWDAQIDGTNGGTAPLIRLIARGVHAITCNTFRGRATYQTGLIFHIEDATGNSYASHNRIHDFNFEQTAAGAVKILSGYDNTIDSVGVFDLISPTSAPMIHIGKSANSNLSSQKNRINTYYRAGGPLGVGQFDITLEPGGASQTALTECGSSSSFKVDWGGNTATAVNTTVGTVNANSVMGMTPYGVKHLAVAKGAWYPATDVPVGTSIFDTTSGKVLTSNGTAWTDGAGVTV